MYADRMTGSMRAAIDETYRRRERSRSPHNEEHGIEPRGIVKEIRDLTDRVRAVAEESSGIPGRKAAARAIIAEMPRDELARMIKDLESQMKDAARDLEFEKAALLRDQIVELRRIIEVDPIAVGR